MFRAYLRPLKSQTRLLRQSCLHPLHFGHSVSFSRCRDFLVFPPLQFNVSSVKQMQEQGSCQFIRSHFILSSTASGRSKCNFAPQHLTLRIPEKKRTTFRTLLDTFGLPPHIWSHFYRSCYLHNVSVYTSMCLVSLAYMYITHTYMMCLRLFFSKPLWTCAKAAMQPAERARWCLGCEAQGTTSQRWWIFWAQRWLMEQILNQVVCPIIYRVLSCFIHPRCQPSTGISYWVPNRISGTWMACRWCL